MLLALPPPDPGFEVFVASRGISQGLAQTDGIQVRPKLVLRIGDAEFGGQWRNISSPAADGVAMLFVRYRCKVGETQLEGLAAYRIRTGSRRPYQALAWEFTGVARRTFKGGVLRAEIQYSPDEFGTGSSLYLEAGPVIDLVPATTISFNLGRRERHQGPEYTSFNVGVTSLVRRELSFDARLYATDRGRLGSAFEPRVVLSVRLSI